MGAGVVTLREGFEASLIVGIVLAFLDRTGRRDGFLAVWIGAMLAVTLSIAFGIGLFLVGAELEGTAEAVWEGGTMLFAAGLLTWMVFWMRKQARFIRKDLEGRVQAALATGSSLALGTVAFVGVAREGLETSLFLVGQANSADLGAPSVLVGAVIGLLIAAVLGVGFYQGSRRLNLATFFRWTGVALIFIAAGLLSVGVHELIEIGVIQFGTQTLWFYFRPRKAQTS